MWWKQHKWKVILPIAIVAILAGAFWYGGSAPGLQGWSAAESAAPDSPPSESAPVTSQSPAQSATPAQPSAQPSPEPTAQPSPEPDAQPSEPSVEEETPPPVQAGDQEYSEENGMVIDPETGKDKYLTDPVPEGKPLPVEPENAVISDTAHTCTISIACNTILEHMDWLDSEKTELVPEDGWILAPIEVTFYEGESVFNVLQRTCKQQKIHMEFTNTPMYNSAYIEGINNLYEFDCGEQSGWMYSVNDWFPNYGCSRYQLQAGDVICWKYTCDLGKDVGGYNALG